MAVLFRRYCIFPPLESGTAEGYESHSPQEGDQLALYVEVIDAWLYTQRKMTDKIPILPVLRSDANQDGIIDMKGLMSVIKFIVQDTICPSMTNADANADGDVDMKDLMRIIKSIVEVG